MSVTLPKGWLPVKFTDILGIRGGSQPPKKDFIYEPREGYVRLLQIRDFGDKPFPTYVPVSSKLRIVGKDDLLLARYGGTSKDDSLGRICTGMEGAYNVALVMLLFTPDFTPPGFIKHLFGAHFFLEVISKNSRSCQTGFNKDDLEEVSFPLPPLNEQKRIVTKLDKIIPRIDSVQARLEKVPTIIKRFRQSVLTAAVTGKLTEKWREEHPEVESAEVLLERIRQDREYRYKKQCEVAKQKGDRKPKKPENLCPTPIGDDNNGNPLSWVYATFRDISSTEHYAMTSGPFGSALGTKDYQVTGTPVIRGQNIQPGRFNDSGFVYISEAKSKELNRSKAQPGDIVIVAVGAGVGNSAILPETIKSAILSQNCNKFTVDCQVVLNSYILSALQISVVRTQMDESTTDTARQFLSLTNLKGMVFPLPPLEEQQEIVRQVDKLFALADKLEAHYQKAKTHIGKLSQSVLAKAFRGELVPQDPSDEPADKLLARIMEEKNEKSKGPAAKRTAP